MLFYASQPHYARHLAPVATALFTRGHPVTYGGPGSDLSGRCVVASGVDSLAVARAGGTAIYLEHGAGQSYTGDGKTHSSYPGGGGHDHVEVFITPGDTAARRWRNAYPQTPVVPVGCPALDAAHRNPTPSRPMVAVVFHWRCTASPESGTAYETYANALGTLAAIAEAWRYDFAVHLHPKWDDTTRRFIASRFTMCDYETVLGAEIVIADNTSAIPEAASLGRTVIMMDSPSWRRHIHHGARFWEWTHNQPTAADPADLAALLSEVLHYPLTGASGRADMVAAVYDRCDGNAASRAAEVIEWLL